MIAGQVSVNYKASTAQIHKEKKPGVVRGDREIICTDRLYSDWSVRHQIVGMCFKCSSVMSSVNTLHP